MSCNGQGHCTDSPCPREKLFRLFFVTEKGEKHLLAEDRYVDAKAAEDLMGYWHPGLDSSSCTPVIEPVAEEEETD